MSGQTIILRGDSQRILAKSLIDKAPQDAVVNIREASRTSAQNDLMWSILGDISRAKPEGRVHTTEQWKSIFMSAAGHKPVFLPDLDGESFVCMGYKSSRLTKAEMSDLIERIYAHGAEHGVRWSA